MRRKPRALMDLVVCVKQVPDPGCARVDPKTGTVVREGVKAVVNPLDLHALEAAVSMREACGGTVTAISMGPPGAAEALREALARGADNAILISGKEFAGADTLATAYALSLGIRKTGSYELVICGRNSTDGDTGQVGPEIAEFLGTPHCTEVRKIREVGTDSVVVERAMDGWVEVVEMPLPGLLTVVREINRPRLPSLRGLMKAKTAEIQRLGAGDLNADAARLGAPGSPTRVAESFQVALGELGRSPARGPGGGSSSEGSGAGEAAPEGPDCLLIEGSAREQARKLLRLFRESGVPAP